LIERLNDTNAEVTVSLLLLSNLFQAHRKKKVHFLSGEFMIGRLLQLNLINIGLEDEFKEALNNLGVNLNDLYA
jgi:starch phosphorylase